MVLDVNRKSHSFALLFPIFLKE